MNLNQLRFAKTLADTQSFIRTAEICNATQPTVSNAISTLESELGERLFSRTTRMVEVTEFGLHLLPLIESILSTKDELITAARSYIDPAQKIFRIGLSPMIDVQYLDRILENFKQKYPDSEFFFKECFMEDLPARIDRQQLDIAVVAECDAKNYRFRSPCYTEPLLFIPQELGFDVPPISSIFISDLIDTPVILTGGGCGLNDTIQQVFDSEKLKLHRYRGQALSYRVIEEWANLGFGAGILPLRKIGSNNPSGVPLLLENCESVKVQYYWVWNKHPASEKPFARLLEYVS